MNTVFKRQASSEGHIVKNTWVWRRKKKYHLSCERISLLVEISLGASFDNDCVRRSNSNPDTLLTDNGKLALPWTKEIYRHQSLNVVFNWSFLFGAVKQFCRFWIWSETECKTLAEYDLQYNSTPPPNPTPRHTLSVCTVHLVWEGGEGGGRSERM